MKNKLVLIKMTMLTFMLIFTLVNLAFNNDCNEAGEPTWKCERIVNQICDGQCYLRGSSCELIHWDGNYCEHATCWEWWDLFCHDGYYWHYQCINNYRCPF